MCSEKTFKSLTVAKAPICCIYSISQWSIRMRSRSNKCCRLLHCPAHPFWWVLLPMCPPCLSSFYLLVDERNRPRTCLSLLPLSSQLHCKTSILNLQNQSPSFRTCQTHCCIDKFYLQYWQYLRYLHIRQHNSHKTVCQSSMEINTVRSYKHMAKWKKEQKQCMLPTTHISKRYQQN